MRKLIYFILDDIAGLWIRLTMWVGGENLWKWTKDKYQHIWNGKK